MNKKLLLLGSVFTSCPPQKQGGTEWVAYYQAKHLAKKDVLIIFLCVSGTKDVFVKQLALENESQKNKILKNIKFIEIAEGIADTFAKIDLSKSESSRKLRLEMVSLSKVVEVMLKRKNDYDIVLNNIRGEAIFLPLAEFLKKRFINVLHLNLFEELASLFSQYRTELITISNWQRKKFPNLNYLSTIYNPVNTHIYKFSDQPSDYALMMGTIGYHKNQKDAVLACKKAGIKLILAGKIRDKDYFDKEIAPFVDSENLVYYGELDFSRKLELYQKAKVFLFPIAWSEPFGLVMIEALSCGTPVIAYPNGGPAEIVVDGRNGFLAKDPEEMAERIKEIDQIDRKVCREDVEKRFSEEVIGEKYYHILQKLL